MERLKREKSQLFLESGDAVVNNEVDNQVRDKRIVEDAAKKFEKYNKIDIVFGSGHAIRERRAWEEYFDQSQAA